MDVKFKNFKNVCRTCFSDKCIKSISTSVVEEGIKITDILTDFIPKEDLFNDKLPQNMCLMCVDQLTAYFKFKQRCQKNESLLKSFLEQASTPSENCTFNSTKNESKDYSISFHYDSGNTDSADDDIPLVCRLEKPKIDNNLDTNVLDRHNQEHNEYKSVNKNKKIKVVKNNVRRHLEKPNYKCKQCKKSFTLKYKLAMHMRVHTKEKPFKCDICPLSFSLNGNLKRHKMIHTGEKPHICEICGKGFIQATSLKMHSRQHHEKNVQQNFTCKICCRVFVRAAPYNSHLRNHYCEEVEKEPKEEHSTMEYKCDICGKHFGTLAFLQRHTLRHGEKKFLCSDCGKGFIRKADLQSHIKVHTGEKPYKCNICNKSFAHMGSLVTHSSVHSGHKPYSCSLCSKTFTQVSHLTVHKRTHSGERPYSCSFCGKTFALNSNLTVHVRTHTGETPYLCNVCGKGFYDSSSMKKHKLSHFNSLETHTRNESDNKELTNESQA